MSEPNTGDYRKRYFFYDGQDLIGFNGGNILESIEHFRSSLRIQVMWFVFFNWSILAVGPVPQLMIQLIAVNVNFEELTN